MKRVLVVDDDRNIRRLIGMHLQRKGLKAEFAINGLEAVSLTKKHEYSLIIIDVHMPEMNGIDAVMAIRANEIIQGRAGATVIAMSSDDAAITKVLDAGANEFFLKTALFQKLPETISRWLAGIGDGI